MRRLWRRIPPIFHLLLFVRLRHRVALFVWVGCRAGARVLAIVPRQNHSREHSEPDKAVILPRQADKMMLFAMAESVGGGADKVVHHVGTHLHYCQPGTELRGNGTPLSVNEPLLRKYNVFPKIHDFPVKPC
eukprot:gene15157-biopygen12705